MAWYNTFRPLTAAARVATIAQINEAERVSVASSEVWDLWRTVGEVHYATTQQARLMTRIGWDVWAGETEWTPEQSEAVLWSTFGDSLDELVYNMALHLQVAGGCYLVQLKDVWTVFPKPLGTRKRLLDGATVIVDVCRPDPVDPKSVDSPVMAALDVLREMRLVRIQSRAQARSRIAQSKIWVYPVDGVSDPKVFEDDIMDVMLAPLQDEQSASVAVPVMVGMRGDKIAQNELIDVGTDHGERLHERIVSLREQLATMMDIPPELLTGMGDTNHWGQWAIQEDNWLGHVEPYAKLVGEGLAEAIGKASKTDGMRVLPDPGPLMQRRPTVSEAADAYKLGAVSAEFYRAALGADDDDAGDGIVKVGRVSDRSLSEPVTAAAKRAPDPIRLMSIDWSLFDGLEDSLSNVVEEILSRLGARIKASAQHDPELKKLIDGVPLAEIPAKVGPEHIPGDQTLRAYVAERLPERVGKVRDRAYRDLEGAGVSLEQDSKRNEAVTAGLILGAALMARRTVENRGTRSIVWASVKAAINVYGGGLDTMPDPVDRSPATPGETPAPGEPGGPVVPGESGFALGPDSLDEIKETYGATPVTFVWEHRYIGKDPHPEHVSFDGLEFDGATHVEDGIEWYPGDHDGCMCVAVPVWETE